MTRGDKGKRFSPFVPLFTLPTQQDYVLPVFQCYGRSRPLLLRISSAHAIHDMACTILVPRGRAPFGQHQESRPLARSNDIPVLNGFVNTID